MEDKNETQLDMVDAIQVYYPDSETSWCGNAHDDLRMTGMAQRFVENMVSEVKQDHARGTISLGKRLSHVESFIEGYRMALPTDSGLYETNGQNKVKRLALNVGEAAGLPAEMIDCAWETHAP